MHGLAVSCYEAGIWTQLLGELLGWLLFWGGGAGHNNDGDSRPGLRAGGRGLEQNEGFRIVSTKEQTRIAVRQRTQIPAARLCQR